MQILERVQDLPKAGNIKAQWVCLWSGPAVGLVLLIAAAAFPGFWPPMSPTLPADEVARFYAEHVLPKAGALLRSVLSGGASILALTEEQF